MNICKNCSIEFKSSRNALGKFCSNRCSAEYRKKESEKRFDNNNNFSGIHVKVIRRYLINVQKGKCSICDNSVWNNKEIPLILDHIDGNSDNWSRENLRMICPNCDAQTPTFKSKNRGNGRFFRRLRYKNGQSY